MNLAERLWREGQRLMGSTWRLKPGDMAPQEYMDRRRMARLFLEAAAILDPRFVEKEYPAAPAHPLEA